VSPRDSEAAVFEQRLRESSERARTRFEKNEEKISAVGHQVQALEVAHGAINVRLSAVEKQLDRLTTLSFTILGGVLLAIVLSLLHMPGAK
jgi:hypothetical protein